MEWLKIKLDDICDVITKGTTPRTFGKEYMSSGIPFLRVENLKGDEIKLDENTIFINQETDKILSRSRIYSNDILLSIAGTIGRSAIVPENSPQMNCNQAVAIIRTQFSFLDKRFFLYWLKTADAKQQILGSQVTLTIANLSLGQIKKIQIPLPPLSEQKRIVEILDRADELRKQRAEADALSERILPALFIKMFGDPATNPMGWDVVDLGDLIKDGPQNGLYKPASFYGEGTPILRIDSFYDGVVDTSKELKRLKLTDDEIEKYKLFENDIIINRVNGSRELFGKSALIPNLSELTVFESNIMKFSVFKEKIHPIYVIRHLQTTSVKQQILNKGKHINQYSVNQGDLKSLKILLPPYSLQESFAKKITETIKIIKYQSNNSLKINHLFQNLLYRAFSGELTAQWREAHMTELLQEMEHQAKALNLQTTLF